MDTLHLARPSLEKATTAPASRDAFPFDSDRGAPRVETAHLEADIRAACATIPPSWTLRNFVAVNPYLGFTKLPFGAGMAAADRVFHARPFMPASFYAQEHANGRITRDDLVGAVRELQRSLGAGEPTGDPDELADELIELLERDEGGPQRRVLTLAEALDANDGSSWAALVVNDLSRWLAGRFDVGQAAWPQPGRELPLYQAWRLAACIDRQPELSGLRGFRRFVSELPEKPFDAIALVVGRLGVPEPSRQAFLARQLASIGGWAAHCQREAREGAGAAEDGALQELLAMRLAYDGALLAAFGGRELLVTPLHTGGAPGAPARQRSPRHRALRSARRRGLVWQTAFENAYRKRLLTKLAARAVPAASPHRPAFQAVFCIDVRSEIFRRQLEALDPGIETIGFAGFFGVPIEVRRAAEEGGSARCPVLIRPSHRVHERAEDDAVAEGELRLARERHRLFVKLRKLAVGTFPLVETLGHGFGLRLLTDAFGWTHPRAGGALFGGPGRDTQPSIDPDGASGIQAEDRVALAEGILRNMGLREVFAPVVLLCGHGSSSSNNPYASSLDCGACGGHPGDANARVACAILNDPRVRAALRDRGFPIPDDTVFAAGLHDTTRDEVTLFSPCALPEDTRSRIQGWLEQAGRRAAAERAPRLGETRGEALRRRATDWSEVRPEWGLAGNAAFVAAPRGLTRGLDLQGRTFLHDYDESRDPDASVLELILTAPLVVASWINLQYYASTVDNDVLGSGDKTIHNVTGRHGVMLGNRSDLQTGLPWQSVHDGTRFVHEPMRLQAIVRASLARIDAVLDAHEELRQLVENQWVHLIAWDPATGAFHVRSPRDGRARWERLAGRP